MYNEVMFNDCIIMAGGSGSRLWPASNSKQPKQFLSYSKHKAGGKTFFSAALERGLEVIDRKGDGNLIIIAGENHVSHVLRACMACNADDRKHIVLIPEPEPKNTASAIMCSIIYVDLLAQTTRNMLVITSDHIIEPLSTFKANAAIAEIFSVQDKLVVFGIPPVSPETGYGYVEAIERLPIPESLAARSTNHVTPEVYKVLSFKEKPDRNQAEIYQASRRFYWNSGMFAFSSIFMIKEFKYHAPDVFVPFNKLKAPAQDAYTVQQGVRILSNWPKLKEVYNATSNVSFDYAIAEKCSQTVMVGAGFEWRDVGSWDEYAKVVESAGSEVYQVDTESCFVDADIPVALCGVKDLIVVVRSGKNGEPPAVLVARKGETQHVREIVKQIQDAGRQDIL
jgi:mannose-1-phosphate guanylyltransferase/mannose-6-phosphate isomerase